jgi:hypothetical protein
LVEQLETEESMFMQTAQGIDSVDQVRPENRGTVKAEIARLDASVAAGFSGSVDREWAGIADGQGMGGPERLGHVEPAVGQPVASVD